MHNPERLQAVCALVCALLVGTPDQQRFAARVGTRHQESAPSTLIDWHTRLEYARAAALGTNQPMLLEFWAERCAPCRIMESQVYSKEGVAAAMKKMIPWRWDGITCS